MATLSLIASVLQVADIGVRLSCKLVSFGVLVGDAEKSIMFISKDISYTSSILRELGQCLERDYYTKVSSEDVYRTAAAIVKDCQEVFEQMDEALMAKMTRLGLHKTTMLPAIVAFEEIKWPFLQPKIDLLWANLDKLKSTLLLLLNVIIYTRLVKERTESLAAVEQQRMLVTELLRSNTNQICHYESLRETIEKNSSRLIKDVKLLVGDSSMMRKSSDRAMMPTDSSLSYGVEESSSTRGVDPSTERIQQYCSLIHSLLARIGMADDIVGDGTRARMIDVIIESHKRETRLLSILYGPVRLKETMRGETWRLAEIGDEVPEGSEAAQADEASQHARHSEPAVAHLPFAPASVVHLDASLVLTGTQPTGDSDLAAQILELGIDENTMTKTAAQEEIERTWKGERKEAYGVAEPIIFDGSAPAAFELPIDCRMQYKSLPSMREAGPKRHHDRFLERRMEDNGNSMLAEHHAAAWQNMKKQIDHRRLQHGYAIDSYLDSTDDPFNGLQADRMSPVLDSWISEHQGLVPIRRTETSMMVDSAMSNALEGVDASQDLVTLISDVESLTTESQATSEGEKCLNSCRWRLEREP